MRWSQTHLYTLREAPSDAEIPSHKLMIRAGLIKKVAPGLYSYGVLGLRAIRKFENIIREELNKKSCNEILMPMVQPRELWEETKRWSEMGAGLLKFQNRNEHWFCLGPTHEEVITDYVRNDLKSYKDLPRNIYQIQTKYRDEIRPRFGLMRGREFIMKDAYSFDADQAGAQKSYEAMYQAYQSIFDRLGLDYRIVQADAGNIGGSQTHEFQLLAEAGEDALLVSDTTNFAANVEVCPAIDFEETAVSKEELKAKEEFATPGLKTIDALEKALNIPAKNLVKTIFVSMNEGFDKKDQRLLPVCVLLRGSDELNLVKLKNILGLSNPPRMLTDEEVFEVSGAHPGSCGPNGLQIPIYADNGLQNAKNFITGANKDGFHLRNVNFEKDFQLKKFADLRTARVGDKCPESTGKLKAFRGIEVGHVFYLGKKYSEIMKASFLDSQGKSQAFEMGCYGIGVTRVVQACIEQSHDADGIIWPKSIAPFQIHFCLLDLDPEMLQTALNLKTDLEKQGLEVFLDDRNERPGSKFKDADLLGLPMRIVLGKKSWDQSELEIFNRKTKTAQKLSVKDKSDTKTIAQELAKIYTSF